MKIDGRCHCGNVTYGAEIDPSRVSICYCMDCQMLTGSAYRVTAITDRRSIRVTGAPKLYTKTGDNGRRRLQYFCPERGSPLFTAGEGADSDEWGIRWGSIRQRQELAPQRQIWCCSAPSWVDQLGVLPGSPGD